MRRHGASRRTLPALCAVAALSIAGLRAAEGSAAGPAEQPLLSAGLSGNAEPAAFLRQVLPATAEGRYVPDSSVLESTSPAGPQWLFSNWPGKRDPADPRAVAWARSWLRAGTVPGRTEAERAVAGRALLDLALLTDPGGASVANPHGIWNYAWPRDAAWHAAAFAVTGHLDEAERVLHFFARAQDRDGSWAARYHVDGSPVRDGRARQLDAVGWLPWATWLWWKSGGRTGKVAGDRPAALRRLWPMVAAAAEAAVRSLRADGLPRPSSDYTEQRESASTIGTAAALLLGLRAAADLAQSVGVGADRWIAAARRLDTAITTEFGSTGYRRYASRNAGPDSAVAFLGAPLSVPSTPVPYSTLTQVADELLMPSGGLRPGNMRGVRRHTFTPATALFALAAAGADDELGFRRWFDWLVAHRTGFEAFPEKVTADGAPAAVAPLGWTSSIVVLALATRDAQVPAPPPP